jgi:hypothetical protein
MPVPWMRQNEAKQMANATCQQKTNSRTVLIIVCSVQSAEMNYLIRTISRALTAEGVHANMTITTDTDGGNEFCRAVESVIKPVIEKNEKG